MRKISKAERQRRKEKAIYDYATHLLNIIWACRDNAEYNRITYSIKDQYMYLKMYGEFERGCWMSDGRKWYKRLNQLFIDYEQEHGRCVK